MTSHSLPPLFQTLNEAESGARRASGTFRSLAPGRREPTPLTDLILNVPEGDERSGLGDALAEGIARVVRSQADNFPENIFWDLDFVVSSFARAARRTHDPQMYVERACDAVVALQRLFGPRTDIRFRYAHDFMYGFDWAKWVRRDPTNRAAIGPFDMPFLEYTRRRGNELLTLIENNDQAYPRLRDDRPRNPFAFSREPEAETQLLEALAARGKIPVEAWNTDAAPRWDRPYAVMREEVARELGIAIY